MFYLDLRGPTPVIKEVPQKFIDVESVLLTVNEEHLSADGEINVGSIPMHEQEILFRLDIGDSFIRRRRSAEETVRLFGTDFYERDRADYSALTNL